MISSAVIFFDKSSDDVIPKAFLTGDLSQWQVFDLKISHFGSSIPNKFDDLSCWTDTVSQATKFQLETVTSCFGKTSKTNHIHRLLSASLTERRTRNERFMILFFLTYREKDT